MLAKKEAVTDTVQIFILLLPYTIVPIQFQVDGGAA